MDKSIKLWIKSQENLIEQLELQISNSQNVIFMEKKILKHTQETLKHELNLLNKFLNQLNNANTNT
jgi:hypothetical protein